MDKTLQRWANIAVIAFAVYFFGNLIWNDYQRRVEDIRRVSPGIYERMDR